MAHAARCKPIRRLPLGLLRGLKPAVRHPSKPSSLQAPKPPERQHRRRQRTAQADPARYAQGNGRRASEKLWPVGPPGGQLARNKNSSTQSSGVFTRSLGASGGVLPVGSKISAVSSV